MSKINKKNIQRSEYKNVINSKIDFIFWNADILEVNEADCLVNCTGPHFQHNSGIAKVICEAADEKQLQKIFKKYIDDNNYLNYEEVFVTDAFKLKNYKKILHVASPYHKLPKNDVILRNTIYNIFEKTFIKLNFKSLVMPLIGTGMNGIQIDVFIGSFYDAIDTFIKNETVDNFKIHIVNNSNSFDSINNSFQVYFQSIDKNQNKTNVLNHEDDNDDADDKEKISIAAGGSSIKSDTNSDNNCCICIDTITNEKKLDKCGHKFCKDCIENYFKSVKETCPICGIVYGISKGTQPPGTMHHRIIKSSLPGYEKFETIQITYNIPNGTQGPEHPHPGSPYYGTTRSAYLPNNQEGNEILKLLKKAFNNRLIFTVGQSRTTNADNVVTWNDIHHKTNMTGGPTAFGYPDPTYLNRVRQELAAKGIV